MVDYEVRSIITATASAIAGEGESITNYNWYLDTYLQVERSGTLRINSDDLALGSHVIKLTVQNSCGEWSQVVAKDFNLVYTCPLPTADFILS